MTHQTRNVRVRLRTWTGHAEPDLAEWLGDAPHHFEGDQLVIHGEGADEDVRPRPGWHLVGWPDGVVTVASGRTAARLYEPATDTPHADPTVSELRAQIAEAIGRTDLLVWPKGKRLAAADAVLDVILPAARITAGLARDSEAAVQRVIALYERWAKAGTPIGTSISRSWDRRLVELRDAILGDEAEASEARGSLVRWYVERKDHDGWVPASSPTRPRESVVQALAERRMEFPDREFRLVRATTSYAVEAEPSP